jgi:hypothetical protein
VTDALLSDLTAIAHDFNSHNRGGLISLSMEVSGSPEPTLYYREKQLETEVVCENCTLRYAIYGVFGYCPDCGTHNSRQILEKNLELAAKELVLAETAEQEVAEYLIRDALENAVSSFDGFGHETCRIHSNKATDPARAENISFQNLANARQRVNELYSLDLASAVTDAEWDFACCCFQKRHLLAHKMGVIDQAYVDATRDPQAIAGRKVAVEKDEVLKLIDLIKKIGVHLTNTL